MENVNIIYIGIVIVNIVINNDNYEVYLVK